VLLFHATLLIFSCASPHPPVYSDPARPRTRL